MTVRAFSISAGLTASTVAPGNTAPVESLTIPAMTLCACAAAGASTRLANAAATEPATILQRIHPPVKCNDHATAVSSSRHEDGDRHDSSPNEQQIMLRTLMSPTQDLFEGYLRCPRERDLVMSCMFAWAAPNEGLMASACRNSSTASSGLPSEASTMPRLLCASAKTGDNRRVSRYCSAASSKCARAM